jgi:hypothetical protein
MILVVAPHPIDHIVVGDSRRRCRVCDLRDALGQGGRGSQLWRGRLQKCA